MNTRSDFWEDEYKQRDWWRRNLLHGRTAREYLRLTGGVSRLEVVIRRTPAVMVRPDPNEPVNPLLADLDWEEKNLEPYYQPGSVELALRIVPDPKTYFSGYYISAEALLASTFSNDEFHIFTCECGSPECAGIKSGVDVVHEDGLVVWRMRGISPRRAVVFDSQQYRGEVLEKIRAALTAHQELGADAWFNGRRKTEGVERLWRRAWERKSSGDYPKNQLPLTPPKDSRKLLVLIGQEPDESWTDFKAKVIQQFKDKGILKPDDGNFNAPPKTNQNKQDDQTKT